MAPEQIERPSEVDHRADLYSVGVILYEMLTGELPLGRFLLPSQKAHSDPRLDQVVLRALEKEPERRYQQAGEILTQVETLSAPAIAAVRSRKMAVVYQVGIGCALALIAVLAYALIHSLTNPKIITQTVTRTVTNTVTNIFGRGPNSGFPRGFGPGRGPGPGQGPGPGFDPGFFTNSLEGLSLGARGVAQLQLNPDQLPVVNAILHATLQDFAQMQSNFVSHTKDDAGHVHLTVKPLPPEAVAQVAKLREQMWKELASVFTPAQLSSAREPFDARLLQVNTNRTETREMWKDRDGEYHFVDDLESVRGGETIRSNASTNISIIPRAYRSLLE
jgi:hypothetical protein